MTLSPFPGERTSPHPRLSVLAPDRFYGGIIGALLAAVAGAFASGYLLSSPGIPPDNPPGVSTAVWPIPGSIIALLRAYLYGARRERLESHRRKFKSNRCKPAAFSRRLRGRIVGP